MECSEGMDNFIEPFPLDYYVNEKKEEGRKKRRNEKEGEMKKKLRKRKAKER